MFHYSDCAVHNAPAKPPGPCDCGGAMNFQTLLTRAGITKAELARRLGLNPRTVSMWGDNPPRYAAAYLELLIESHG